MEGNRHIAVVNAAVVFHRALWKLRGATGKSTEDVLAMRTVRKEYRPRFLELRRSLKALRKAWPQCTELQCVDIATTITQAASLALVHELRHPVRDRPKFDATTVHQVVEGTVQWMATISNRSVNIGRLLARIKDRPLPGDAARKLRDQLIKDMPGILQWMDEQAAV